MRDYIHVVDLALGHLRALERVSQVPGAWTVNLGTGQGYSVLEMIRAFEKASGRPIPYQIASRRSGDIASCYADPAHAFALLGWKAQRNLDEMCIDGWRGRASIPTGILAPRPDRHEPDPGAGSARRTG